MVKKMETYEMLMKDKFKLKKKDKRKRKCYIEKKM